MAETVYMTEEQKAAFKIIIKALCVLLNDDGIFFTFDGKYLIKIKIHHGTDYVDEFHYNDDVNKEQTEWYISIETAIWSTENVMLRAIYNAIHRKEYYKFKKR